MVKSMKMVKAGKKAWATRRLRAQQNENEPTVSRSEAARKAWRTIRANKKLFEGFEKPSGDFKFGIHLSPLPSCTGPLGEDRVMYYESKKEMQKDIKKFQRDDQIFGITIFQVICLKGNEY